MTIDEIIGAFQEYATLRRLSITSEVEAAIPILREAKQRAAENWGREDDLVCPYCGNLLLRWTEGEPGEEIHFYCCPPCNMDIPVENKYRVIRETLPK